MKSSNDIRDKMTKNNVNSKKLLHNFFYWTNPVYMISNDLKNSPKAQAFIVEHFGHIIEPIIIWLAKILNRFKRRK